MEFLPILGYSGMTLVLGYISKSGHNDLKQINSEKKEMLNNMITISQFPSLENSKQTLFKNRIDTECGEVNIYKQRINTTIRHISPPYYTSPINTYTYIGSSAAIIEATPVFYLLSKFLTDGTFGHDHLVSSQQSTNCIHKNLPIQSSVMLGNDLQDKLKSEHNITNFFDANYVHRYDYRSFKGQDLYFSGKKFDNKFVYNCLGTCPESVVDDVYKNRENIAKITKYGGGIAGLGITTYGIIDILSRFHYI